MQLATVGVLIDWLDDDYQNQLLEGAAQAARQHGVRLVTFVGGALDGAERYRFGKHRNFIYELASPTSLDALLISAGTLVNAVGPARLATWCRRFEPLPMCTVSVPLRGIPCVRSDDAAGIRLAISALIRDRGFTRIVHLRGPHANPEADARYAAYVSSLAAHDVPLDPELVIDGEFIRQPARAAVRGLLDRRVPFQAIVAANDEMALGALDELTERGLRVPEDVALVGFDDTTEGRFAPVPLSTVRQPIRGLGRCAVELLLQKVAGREVPEETKLPTFLVTRTSCGLGQASDLTSSLRVGDSLAATLELRRGRLLERLSTYTAEAEQLLNAFVRALEERSPERLARQLLAVANRAMAAGEDSASWRAAVAMLEAELRALATCHRELDSFTREHLRDLQVAVTELGERFQARKVLVWQQHVAVLRRIGEDLLTSMDTEGIMRLLAREVPDLGLPSCHINLFERDRVQHTAELVLEYAEGRPAELSPRRFAALDLVPGGVRAGPEATNLILQPLHFEEEQLGFAVFGTGTREGSVYEALREQVSSALKRTRLIGQLVQQTTLRERAERAQLQKELELAVRLQTAILPRQVRVPGLEFSAHMRPLTEVGGDYYDVIPCEGGCWLGIGDVAGHGLRTGLVMLMLQSMLAALVRRDSEQLPSALLRAVNGALFENVRERLLQDEHATLSILRYQRQGRIQFAGAHEPPLVYRAAERRVEQVPTPGCWVGIVPELDEVEDSELQLSDGDVIVLYTDGVTEARNANKEMFGLERLAQLVGDSGQDPVERIRDRILQAVLGWSPAPEDDVTVLVARHRAQAEP